MGEGTRPGELQWAHEDGGMPYPPGRTLLPRGFLVVSPTSSPSLLVCFQSKKDHREGFVPFCIPFLQNSKIGKKTKTGTGPSVNRLVPKNNIKEHIKAH